MPVSSTSAPTTPGAKPAPAEALLEQARAHQRAGRFAEAEAAYRQLTAQGSAPALAWHGLGVLLARRDECTEALPCLRRALEMQPADPDFWLDYAATFLLAGQADEAHLILTLARQRGIAHPRLAIVAEKVAMAFAVTPDLAGIRERFKQAEACGDYAPVAAYINQQLERFGPRSMLLQRLGTVRLRQQRYAESLDNLDEALRAPNPDTVNLYNQRGIVLKRLGRHDEALEALHEAHRQAPEMVGIWVNLGDCLNTMGNYQEARDWLEKALQASPGLPEALVNLAASHLGLERYEQARVLLQQALDAGHASASARLGLAEALMHLGQSGQALEQVRQMATSVPADPKTLGLLQRLLLNTGALEEATAVGQQLLALQPEEPATLSSALFNLHYDNQSPEALLALARRYGEQVRVAQPFTEWPRPAAVGGAPARRLRLGLVSGDLCDHPVARFLESVLQCLTARRLELYAYTTRPREDAVTRRLRPLFTCWRRVSGSDQAIARQIHADRIDILIDLSGHTSHHRLPVFAWRPAPLQISWLGWFATTGLAEIDYLLADKTGVPPRWRQCFVERVAWLPHTRLCFTAPAEAPAVSPAPCLHRGHLTFGCFQRLAKLSATTLALWGRLLEALPDARLQLRASGLQASQPRAELLRRLVVAGLPAERIDLAGPLPHAQYLAAYGEVDVMLDTFPYTGGTTTCEALWMGVPTLTLAGDSLLARQGASLMGAAHLTDWVAHSEEDYLRKASAIATDLPTLATLRAGLREHLAATPLFDARRFARDLEILLLNLWRQTGLPRLNASRQGASSSKIATKGATRRRGKGAGRRATARTGGQTASRSTNPDAALNAEFGACLELYKQGRAAEALPGIRMLSQRLTDSAPVWKVLGAVLTAVGQPEEALQAKRRAVELDPNDPDSRANLANSLQDADLLEPAEVECRAALHIQPGHANALNNLGLVLYRQGCYLEARMVLEQALEQIPEFPEAMVNLGNVLRDMGEREPVELLYRQAIRLAPRLLNAHMNLGVLLAAGTPEQRVEAEACYLSALELDSEHPEVLNGLGNLYRDMRRFRRAEECFERAVKRDPTHARAWLGLGGVRSYGRGSLQEAIACFEEALRQAPDLIAVRSNLLFNHAYLGDTEPGEHLRQACLYGDAVSKIAKPYTDWQCATPAPLKVGLIGGDFRQHPVGYFLENLLRHLDRQRIAVHIYNNNEQDDDLTETLKGLVANWHEVRGLPDRQLAKTIYEQGIHVLIDLAGHTGDNRLPLFGWRPAPVQVAWLGYFATTGVAEIDWIIADRMGVPPEHHRHFRERVWYLPDTRLCFSPPREAPPVAPLPALRNGHVSFGCVQNLTKVNDQTLGLWKRVLDALPDTRMRIQAPQFADMKAKDDFLARLNRLGIDVLRITLVLPSERLQYLEQMAEVDFMLDTFPYPGGTTTCEALWMGVPTLTRAGTTLLARQGASLLSAGGLADWVAHSEDDYVSRAIAFASDLQALATLRIRLRSQLAASPLFNAERFARDFEAALYGMWEQSPASLAEQQA